MGECWSHSYIEIHCASRAQGEHVKAVRVWLLIGLIMGATLILSIRGNDLITQLDGSKRFIIYFAKGGRWSVWDLSCYCVQQGCRRGISPRGIAKDTDTYSTTIVNPINIFNSWDHMSLKRSSNRVGNYSTHTWVCPLMLPDRVERWLSMSLVIL